MSVQFRNQTTGTLERAAGFTDTDAVLSATSRNPIQNKAVHAALAQKIDKTVSDLENYYNTSQVYNKQEVRDLIGSINTLTIEVVATLPTQDISSTTIYFVGPAAGTNTYDEYVYVNNTWVKIGDTQIDLSGYVTSAALTTALQSYYDKTQTDALFNDYYDKDTVDDLLNLKQDALTFDNQPIAGSANPVTSAGIKTALDNILISGNGGSIIKVHHLAGAAAAGDTVTASKGSYSVSSTFDASGDAIIIGFGEIGNITIIATNGSETGSTIINIPNFSVYTARVAYGLDYKSWLIEGGIDPSYYDSLDEVLADEEVVRKLMTIHASVDYLATLDRTDDEMAIAVLNNDICAKWINLRDYALDTLYANTYAKAIMDEADKYGYGEWALVGQVPTMTSNTAPYGEAIASSVHNNTSIYYLFDNNDSTTWYGLSNQQASGQWIGYRFVEPICAKTVYLYTYNHGSSTSGAGFAISRFKIQASNDGTIWDDISNEITTTANKAYYSISENEAYYTYYRLYIIATGYAQDVANACDTYALQFYAWQPKGNVPVMTSNTAPYGTVSANSVYSSVSAAWQAFGSDTTKGWLTQVYDNASISYNFTNPVCVRKVRLCNYAYDSTTDSRLKNFKVQGSNNNSTWVDIYTGLYPNDATKNIPHYYDFDNDDYYIYYKILIIDTYNNAKYAGASQIQFYGREMKVSVPAMTSNTAPYGEAFGDPAAYSSNYDFYRAFDKNSSTQAAYINGATQGYFAYDFGRKVAIKYAAIYQTQTTRPTTIIYSDDKVTWVDASPIYSHAPNTTAFIKANDDAGEHRYWALRIVQNSNANTAYMDFFGFDYSERDWDTEHPMHYIYDHGVELEPITYYTNGGTCESNTDSIYTLNTSSHKAIAYTSIDFTDYNLIRVVAGATLTNSCIGLANAKPETEGASDWTYISYTLYPATTIALPYGISLDCSSINTTKYMGLGRASSTSCIGTATEWWLE